MELVADYEHPGSRRNHLKSLNLAQENPNCRRPKIPGLMFLMASPLRHGMTPNTGWMKLNDEQATHSGRGLADPFACLCFWPS